MDLSQELAIRAEVAAKRLLGSNFIRTIDGVDVICRIVETEAYDQDDAASHSYHGQTPRTEVLFGPAGHLYVYFTYGLHYCMNVVTGPVGRGEAVLIRAVEPLSGIKIISANRSAISSPVNYTNGPAKLCQALAVDKELNGQDLQKSPLRLELKPPLKNASIIQTKRVGISKEKDKLRRFYIKDNPYVSKL